MKIYVCIKNVPDSAINIKIVDNIRIDDNITFLINPYDEYAVTEAVKVRDSHEDAEVIVVCLGKDDAQKTIQSALAMGADRGILVSSSEQYDSIMTAKVLKAVIEQDGSPGLIFTGKESIDSEGLQTMFRLGALFGFPVANNVIKLDIKNDRAIVDSQLSGGSSITFDMALPCVIGAGRGLNTPKYPTFPDVMKAKKKSIQEIKFSDLNIETSESRMRIVNLEPLSQVREPKEIQGNAVQAAKEIKRILKQEAKVI